MDRWSDVAIVLFFLFHQKNSDGLILSVLLLIAGIFYLNLIKTAILPQFALSFDCLSPIGNEHVRHLYPI